MSRPAWELETVRKKMLENPGLLELLWPLLTEGCGILLKAENS